jgi:hypothetical protein
MPSITYLAHFYKWPNFLWFSREWFCISLLRFLPLIISRFGCMFHYCSICDLVYNVATCIMLLSFGKRNSMSIGQSLCSIDFKFCKFDYQLWILVLKLMLQKSPNIPLVNCVEWVWVSFRTFNFNEIVILLTIHSLA